jgi:hypothetical protein
LRGEVRGGCGRAQQAGKDCFSGQAEDTHRE